MKKGQFIFKRALPYTLGAVLALTSMASVAKKAVTTPDGFESVMLLMGTGTIDSYITEPRPGVFDCEGLLCGGDFFQKEIMRRSDKEIFEVEMNAKAFFLERFGLDVDYLVAEGRVTFGSFTLNPDFQYRLQISSGMRAKGEGWLIRDGGYSLSITDPNGLDLGGEFEGRHAAQSNLLLFGNYNILVTNKKGVPKREIIIDYKSRTPAVIDDDGFRLQSDVYSEEFGEGLVLGTILMDSHIDGEIRINARTVISFPATTTLESFPSFPSYEAHPREKRD